jgi:hypothetical protein
MGYTHYWRRKEQFNPQKFSSVAHDFKIVLPKLEKISIKLAGPMGTGQPEINDTTLAFNGLESCGHPERDLGITWPSDNAGGVSDMSESVKDGTWFAGAKLQSRACGGDCSHESFVLPQHEPMPDYQRKESYQRTFEKNGNKLSFKFCKTAYKPYDLAVTAALIIAKHHLGKTIIITSDGEANDWFDAALLLKTELGYGLDFKLDKGN